MPDNVAKRVCTVVAKVFGAELDYVRPETALSLADIGWKGFLELALELERTFAIALPIDVPNKWTTVTDVILAVEKATAAARPAQGRAA